jgi:hypothetical protein
MQFNYKKINYTSPGTAQGGPGIGPSIPWYTSPYIDMSETTLRQLGLRLGDTFWLDGLQEASGGNCFKVVKADAALSIGQLVSAATPATSTVGAAAPVPSTASINWVAGGLTVNAEVDNYIWTTTAASAAVGNLRRIKANTATAITVALPDQLRPNLPTDHDVFPFVPVAGDVAAIIRPHHVIVCTASLNPVGVALGTVTQYNYTLIQVAGLALVLSKGDVTATVVNVPAVPGAAGVVSGSAAAAANLYAGGGNIIPQLANAGASVVIPCYVNFTGV